jgi:aspartyl-tRNA(Asn)/glutamyl-tRNA(Gln) amidotransferase subunit B
MNSFRFLERGIKAEVARQEELLAAGEQVVQETLHFDPASGSITSLRSKEEAHDYRYFPEPDLLPVAIDEDMLEAARAEMPELPAERAERLQSTLALSADSAHQLAFRAELGDFFEAALAADAQPRPPAQLLANWVTVELVARLEDEEPDSSRVTAQALARLVALLADKQVSVGAARQVLDRLVAARRRPGRDRRGRGPGGDGRRRRAGRGRGGCPGRQPRRRRAGASGQRQSDRPDRRARDARDQGARRRRRGRAPDQRAAGRLTSWRAAPATRGAARFWTPGQ